MKKALGILLFLGVGLAQPFIPATALHLESRVTLPSNAYRSMGEACDNMRQNFTGDEFNFEVLNHGCYILDQREASRQPIALSLIKQQLELAGYTLFKEDVEEGLLFQIWHASANEILVFLYQFSSERITFLTFTAELDLD